RVDAQKVFSSHKMDHRILNSALKLEAEEPNRQIILVTKDINLRLKAKALGLAAEDYQTGKIADITNIYTGKELVSPFSQKIIDKLYAEGYIEGEILEKSTKKFKPYPN